MKGDLPKNWNEAVAQAMQTAAQQSAPQATRQSSQAMLNAIAPFLPERGKIQPRRISGTCALHQRKLQVAIKRARQLALIPYVTD